ncbi:MAG: AMP-binding protein, partial [Acidobacteriota bacterium]
LNLVENCLGRHARGDDADRECLVGRTELGGNTRYTFRSLHAEVLRCAAAMQRSGIEPGDRVASYMPMVVEVVVQMLATIHLGAVFIPIFSGYAPAALRERLDGAQVKLLFTAEASSRRGRPLAVLPQAREGVAAAHSVQKTVVVQRPELSALDAETAFELDADEVSWIEFLAAGSGGCPPASVDSMHPALILFTSGTTGRPKGTVHSHAGTLVQLAKEVGYAFDVRADDTFFWLTDIGWMMGPWSIIGGLFHGARTVLYEGGLDYPETSSLATLLARERVSVFGISPTAVRMLMKAGAEAAVGERDLGSLRILGSTGEPWDEESWHWYFEHFGGRRCPIINISGGTDIIGCFLSPLPLDPLKPCSLVGPGLGMAVDVWNDAGESVRGEVGYLVATKPAPSMTRGLWQDPERYIESYWSTWPGIWNHGDWAVVDDDGQWFLQGRSDDTLKVAGRRIGPAELEGALIETGKVTEAAAIGVPHEIKGTGIVCFAVLTPDADPSEELRKELEEAIVERLGKVDRPERIEFVPDLPKTRSAKILRRLVRARYLGEEDLGDLSSLQNPEAVEAIPVRPSA